MTLGDELLDSLAPVSAWTPDWPDVLERAGVRRSTRLVTKRRVLVCFAMLAAVLVPLAALGAANDWWFLQGGPTPTAAPSVVQEGVWGGHAWQMTAYPSDTDGLCIAITPTGSSTGAAQECGPFAGVARTAQTKASPDMTITYLSGTASHDLPAYIAGPVVAGATQVKVRFGDGTVLDVATVAGTGSLDNVRFYAAPLPDSLQGLRPAPGSLMTFVKSVAGLDANGTVIACLAPPTARNGVSPLSACR